MDQAAREFSRRLRNSEVDQLHVAFVGNKYILRGDVAMHDAQRAPLLIGCEVRVVQARAQITDHAKHNIERESPPGSHFPVKYRPKIVAVYVLHRNEVRVFRVPDFKDTGNVWMGQMARDLRFVPKHRDEFVVQQPTAIRQAPLDDGSR
jgi:hypothetical protein